MESSFTDAGKVRLTVTLRSRTRFWQKWLSG